MGDKGITYEQQVKRNKEENLEFLKSSGFFEKFVDKYNKEKPRPVKIHKIMKRPLPLQPLRKSSRLKNLPAPPPPTPQELEVEERKPNRLLGDVAFEMVCVQDDQSATEKFAKEVTKLEEERPEESNIIWNQSTFSSMKINPSLVTKVVPSKIYSLTFAHSNAKDFLAAGSKTGEIGFWDIGSKSKSQGVYVFAPHTSRVSCLQFNPSHNSEIYSCSFDGTFRCGNLQTMTFEELYQPPSEDLDYLCSSFDSFSPSTFILGIRHGEALLIDKRTKEKSGEKNYILSHTGGLKTIHFHPDKKHFISSNGKGICALWDIRKIQRDPIYEMKHSKSLNSAYFSPSTGKYILTTSMDNKLSIFDSSDLVDFILVKKEISHDNQTGRWLTPFRAEWLPNSEESFVVGSMSYPRRIEVFGIKGNLMHTFTGEDLQTICCINAFHPLKPILAGGNSSGKVYVFKEEA